MQCHSHFTLLFAVFIIMIGALVFLSPTSELTWAEDTHVHDGESDHSHAPENVVTLTDQAKANIGLRTAEVDLRAIETVVHAHGNVIAHPGRQSIVTPRIGGIVKHIHFSIGETVKKGDLLLELESLDLQMMQIELIEALAQKQSLESRLERLTEVFARQIRRELQTRQIDYLQSLSELRELRTSIEKRKTLAIAMITSALEQMRFRLIKADVELQLLDTTLKRTEALAEKRISAQKELIAQQAAYSKGQNELVDAKRQFQILGISDKIIDKILHDAGDTPILSLLKTDETLLEKYAVLSGEGTALLDAESAYEIAAIKVAANKQRALAAGLTETLLDNLAKTNIIVSFNDLSTHDLIENYLAFVESSEALEGVLQLEESFRSAVISLTKVQQKLQVSGLPSADIERVIQTGKPFPMFFVTAPASGQIIKQHVTLGTTVEKSDMLFSILDTDVVWVEGEAHEDTLARIQSKWQIGSEVRIRTSAYPDTVFTGKISHISSVMDPEERVVHFGRKSTIQPVSLSLGCLRISRLSLKKEVRC